LSRPASTAAGVWALLGSDARLLVDWAGRYLRRRREKKQGTA